jgi:hypothetical protein
MGLDTHCQIANTPQREPHQTTLNICCPKIQYFGTEGVLHKIFKMLCATDCQLQQSTVHRIVKVFLLSFQSR